MFCKTLCALVLLAGYVLSDISNQLDVDDIQKNLQEAGIAGVENFNKSMLPNTEEVEKVLSEKCARQGQEGAVNIVKEQKDALQTCISSHVNVTQLKDELEQAKETGSMDEVFAKYCKRWPDIYGCVENVTQTVRLCMEPREARAFNKSLDILMEFQEFMCFKDGDRLAMFVAEGGVECLQSKTTEIQTCVNSTVGNKFPDPSEDFSIASLPMFMFTDEDCDDFDSIRACLNTELERCTDSTPANIVDAALKFLKKQMPCHNDAILKTAPVTSSNGTSSAAMAQLKFGATATVALVSLYSLIF